MPPRTGTQVCTHRNLTFNPSSHTSKAGYIHPTLAERQAATTSQGAVPNSSTSSKQKDVKSSTFPAPLVLPGDELSWDPEYPAQSVKEWIGEKDRNEVTQERKTVYVAAPPAYGAGFISVAGGISTAGWTIPLNWKQEKSGNWTRKETEDVLGYLRAFYHGMEVSMLPHDLYFAEVDEEESRKKTGKKIKGGAKKKEAKSPILWLNTNTHPSTSAELIGIRTRATPKGRFSHQLNLNDLLEAAIEILPEDAYALLMLVQHDIFEDEEDDFACGRAYGGSRVSVVSTARYDPVLDGVQEVPRSHGWPASHCSSYVEKCVEEAGDEGGGGRKRKKAKISAERDGGMGDGASPMHMALAAHASLPSLDQPHSPSPAALSGLLLARVCRTASHELGHCFGIDHCVYYACCMQGTASVVEDARQPPYLCPVDLVKMLRATGADERERYERLGEFCGRFPEVQIFKAFGAWIKGRTEELDGSR